MMKSDILVASYQQVWAAVTSRVKALRGVVLVKLQSEQHIAS
ncbi:hypothetical protein [Lactiplantibacillus carotarum]|nr:hypothetical protein [Lactiplantibacillus carotarum]